MPYSIVLTKEGSCQLISLVPSTWVKDKVLYWPRSKKNSELELLRRNENTVPDENWKKIKCKVKVNGIDTFSEGLKLEDLYSKFEDTEDEERYHKNQEINRKHPILKSVSADLLDLNADFDLIMGKQNTIMEKNNTITEEKKTNNYLEEDKSSEDDPLTNYVVLQNTETNNVTKITNENNMTSNADPVPEHNDANFVTIKLDHLNELMSQNSGLSSENEILRSTIQRFQNLEQETKRGFAAMQVQLDKVFDLLKSKSFSNKDFTEEANIIKVDDMITPKNFEFPINSVEQLDLLENELMDSNFEKALVKKFSSISGTSGTHKIAKIGLQITKSFFTDELLNHFTWKGIKGSSKLPFMKYLNIRNCFHKIVHLADSNCTSLEADSFLQNSAIKHSGQRIKRKSCEMNTSMPQKKRCVMKQNITYETETENYIDEQKIDDDKIVTALSDVKIKNKILDLKDESKIMNISSDNLIDVFCGKGINSN